MSSAGSRRWSTGRPNAAVLPGTGLGEGHDIAVLVEEMGDYPFLDGHRGFKTEFSTAFLKAR